MLLTNYKAVSAVLCSLFIAVPVAASQEVDVENVCDGGGITDVHSITQSDLNELIGEAKSGDPNSAYRVARYYGHSGDNPSKFREWLKVAISHECMIAKYTLGVVYIRDADADESQLREGVHLLTEVYKQGFTPAAYNLGYFFKKEKTRDYEKSRYWFEKLAAVGRTTAMQELVDFYLEGKGGKKEPKKAYASILLLSTRVPPGSVSRAKLKDRRAEAFSQLSPSEIQEATDLFLRALWALPCGAEGDAAYCLEMKGDYKVNIQKSRESLDEWRSEVEVHVFD
jgi:hypothetical protein